MKISKEFGKFILQFIILHVITYMVFGLIFMTLSNYFEYFESTEAFKAIMKPSDDLLVRLAIPIQIIRGGLLALAIYPFRQIITGKTYGWLKLFFLLFILTCLGAVITGPGSIEGFIYTNFPYNPIIGLPEVALQMLAFSYLLYKWQNINK